MSSARQVALAGLLSFAATGCHRATTAAVVSIQAPSIQTTKTPAPPVGNPLSAQSEAPLPSLPPATEDASAHAPPPPKARHPHRKAKPATQAAAAPAPSLSTTPAPVARDISPSAAVPAAPSVSAPQTVAPPPPAASSTIGELSTGDVSAGTAARHKTVELIGSTESGLNSLKRALTIAEQQTALQIRTFITKAKAALDADDLDGAQTLATKAKVLLDELTKQ